MAYLEDRGPNVKFSYFCIASNLALNMMRKLNLNTLKHKLPGITVGQGYFLWEAALLCLVGNKHSSGVILEVTGKFEEKFEIIWEGNVTDEMCQSWGDIKEATEYGAMALAVLVILQLTEYVVSGRSRQGTSIDYFLVSNTATELLFPDPDAILEVSGIFMETKGNTINMRVNEKLKRLEKSGFKNYPAYIVVTEFSKPSTKILKK